MLCWGPARSAYAVSACSDTSAANAQACYARRCNRRPACHDLEGKRTLVINFHCLSLCVCVHCLSAPKTMTVLSRTATPGWQSKPGTTPGLCLPLRPARTMLRARRQKRRRAASWGRATGGGVEASVGAHCGGRRTTARLTESRSRS